MQRIVVQVALADPDADSESLRAACERVLASGAHQVRIIEALLTLSRGQAGLDKREPFDLATLASQMLHARQSDAQDRQLAIRTWPPSTGSSSPSSGSALTAQAIEAHQLRICRRLGVRSRAELAHRLAIQSG